MKMWSVRFWAVLMFTMGMAAQHNCGGKQQERQSSGSCVSSCGKITNITHPFRLKDDPVSCGDSRYELECVNDVAVLRLSETATEYHVQAINYSNYTIRLVDPNIHNHEDDCSSLPRYFLYMFNFSDPVIYSDKIPNHVDVDDIYSPWQGQGRYPDIVPLFEHVIYMRCNTRVSESTTCLDSNTYFVVGDLSATEWKEGCHVKLISPTSAFSYWEDNENYTYSDIHRALAYGFHLSWLQSTCRHQHNCGSRGCYFNTSTHQVLCLPQHICDYTAYHSMQHCGIWKVILHRIRGVLPPFLQGIRSFIQIHIKKYGTASYTEYEEQVQVIGRLFVVILLGVRALLGSTLLAALLIYKWRRRQRSTYANIENFLLDNNNLAPIRYSYREIKNMTKNFEVKLGQGGFGSVYKGKLRSGPHVAIKMLQKNKGNGQDFMNEVATIGRIHHVNVVRLIGFCVEGSKRALVFDFMSNGSLDKYIFSKEGSIPLSYEKIDEISLGIARGISYLHQGCDMQILHFDIKPHNILLDENFVPKVSDFGLAKLYPIDHSMVTLTDKRGTIGYIAPELFYNNLGKVSHKSDVYSFGMLLMELAGKRKNVNPQAENSSEIFFPTWVYDQLGAGKDIELDNETEDEKNIAKKMMIVALWCIQLKPTDRPSMKRVAEMLEGELEDLTMPPKPLLYPRETPVVEENLNSEQISSSDHTTNATSDSNHSSHY